MSRLDDHPTVRAVRGRGAGTAAVPRLAAAEVLALCLDAGAADAGFVSIDRPEIADQRASILSLYPRTRTLVSLVGRMNPEPIRSTGRSVSNLEFHGASDHLNAAARLIVANLALRGVNALNPPVGFPMEMASFPGKVWAVSHKPVAVAAGLGRMGVHRNVIHPKFGSFILLATVLIDAEVDKESIQIDYNPCLDCRLCIAACPVGAISEDGFNFSSCYTHNYREFMGGFTDWVETVAASGSAEAYRSRVGDGESASMWQSLAFGPNYKAAYCLSVCPAGEEVIAPFLADRPGFVRDVVRPLQDKTETLYVQPHSDAADHAAKRFPHKRLREVGAVLRPATIAGFIAGMQHVFQPGRAKGVDAEISFRFTGSESAACTVVIRNQKIEIRDGVTGSARLRVSADSRSWLRFLRKEVGILRLLLTGRVRVKGDPRLLAAFGRCFPG